MMKLENQVVSLELAKRMKELGFEQESLYFYQQSSGYKDIESEPHQFRLSEDISAYTVAELGEMLPKGRSNLFPSKLTNGEWAIVYENRLIGGSFSEADARAKMIIYLKENNLLEV